MIISESIKNKIDDEEDLLSYQWKNTKRIFNKLRQFDISDIKSEKILKYCVWNENKKTNFYLL